MSNNYNNTDDILTFFDKPEQKQRREEIQKSNQKTSQYNVYYFDHTQKNTARKQPTAEQIRKYQQSSNKSIGKKRKVEDKNRKKHPGINRKSKINSICIGLCALTITVSLAIPISIKAGPIIQGNIQTQQNVNKSTDLLMAKALNQLTINDLAGIDIKTGEFVIKENSISDYKKLNITSHLDVYIYKLVLPNSEFEKFIQSVTYNKGIHHYTSMYQFLNINGYYVEGTNSPSIKVFNNMMEERISKYSDELIKEYDDGDGVYTASDYLEEEIKGKGGK